MHFIHPNQFHLTHLVQIISALSLRLFGADITTAGKQAQANAAQKAAEGSKAASAEVEEESSK